MQERYESRFRSLSREQARRIYERLVVERVIPWQPVATDGGSLYTVCRMHGVDQARVVFALGREADSVGVGAIETLIGQPITRRRIGDPPTTPLFRQRRAAAPSSPAPRATDSQVVLSVKPNPKKPGSATFLRYAHWEVGITVAEAMKRGLTRADIAWDVDRGFVTVGEAPTA